MCRFLAYIGDRAVRMADVVESPEHSLVQQSRHSKESEARVNIDGFGLGWYLADGPGYYKSVLPLGNDLNAKEIASHIQSHAFMAHVRASTVGDSVYYNCHPFRFGAYLFCHNGTFMNFHLGKAKIYSSLRPELQENIKGATDSEYFFHLIMEELLQNPSLSMPKAMKKALQTYHGFFRGNEENLGYAANLLLMDGKQLIVFRTMKNATFRTLYYSTDSYFINNKSEDKLEFLVCSEPLTSIAEHWQEVPEESYLWVNEQLKIETGSLELL
jgi:glutamine amidotransferase